MINIKDRDQLEIPGMETWRSMYSERKLKLLVNSWSGVFREDVLPLLYSEKLVELYSEKMGRPSKEIYSLAGAVVLQQFFDLTDDETVSELAFNQQWHFALECFNEDDQVICSKTLWNMRKNIVNLCLDKVFFSAATKRFIDKFEIDTGLQRIDSVHVHSNMARIGRIRLLARTLIKFLKNLKRQDSNLFEKEISAEMIEKYFSKTEDSYFGNIKPSETEQNLQSLANDLHCLKLQFNDNSKISQMSSFKLLLRVFKEQCSVEDEVVKVKPAKKVSSGSVQNPSDPDAGFDGHKGQGYQSQITETYSPKANEDTSEKDKPDVITHIKTEPANKHDSKALMPAIDHLQEQEIECQTMLADAAYGSAKNINEAKEKNVKIVAPVAGRSSEKGLELFDFNAETHEITACLAGKTPDKIKKNQKSITAIWSCLKCKNCDFAKQCPTKERKEGRSINYCKSAAEASIRRKFEKTKEFKDEYRYRSGIEATNSRFIHMTGARRSRYRGLEKMRFAQTMKALAINVFRIAKFMRKGKLFDVFFAIILFLFDFLKNRLKFKPKFAQITKFQALA